MEGSKFVFSECLLPAEQVASAFCLVSSRGEGAFQEDVQKPSSRVLSQLAFTLDSWEEALRETRMVPKLW